MDDPTTSGPEQAPTGLPRPEHAALWHELVDLVADDGEDITDRVAEQRHPATAALRFMRNRLVRCTRPM